MASTLEKPLPLNFSSNSRTVSGRVSAPAVSSIPGNRAMWGRICFEAAPSPAIPTLNLGTRFLAVWTGAGQSDPLVDDGNDDQLVFCRIADDAHRIAALLHDLDLLAQHAAENDDAAVGRTGVLLGAIGNRALRFPC